MLPARDRQCVYVYAQIPVLLTSESERDGVPEDLLQGIIHVHKTKQNKPESFAQSFLLLISLQTGSTDPRNRVDERVICPDFALFDLIIPLL